MFENGVLARESWIEHLTWYFDGDLSREHLAAMLHDQDTTKSPLGTVAFLVDWMKQHPDSPVCHTSSASKTGPDWSFGVHASD